jgi:hypothetical protein
MGLLSQFLIGHLRIKFGEAGYFQKLFSHIAFVCNLGDTEIFRKYPIRTHFRIRIQTNNNLETERRLRMPLILRSLDNVDGSLFWVDKESSLHISTSSSTCRILYQGGS